MNANMPSGTVVLQDQTGTLYLLTPKLLASARVSPEQQAELVKRPRPRLTGDTAGFIQIDLGSTVRGQQ